MVSINRLATSAFVVAAFFTIACQFGATGLAPAYSHRFTGCFTRTDWGGITLHLRPGLGRLLEADLSIAQGALSGNYRLGGEEKSDTVAELTAHRAGPKPTSYKVKLVLTSGSGKKRSITLQMNNAPPSKPLLESEVSVCTS